MRLWQRPAWRRRPSEWMRMQNEQRPTGDPLSWPWIDATVCGKPIGKPQVLRVRPGTLAKDGQ